MTNPVLFDLIRNAQDLPSPPAVVMELLNSIDSDDIDVATLAATVAQDQALTGKTLRLANSPYFATQIKVTTIHQAITLLGFRNVRKIIMTAALTGCFPVQRCAGFDYKMFWRHALATASAAAILARQLGLNADFAFTAGLLHDIGRLVLVTCAPDEYAEVIRYRTEHQSSMLEAERIVLRMDHAQAGEILAAHWNFSETLRLAIAAHHDPDMPGAGFLASIVHVANAIAEQLEMQDDQKTTPAVSLTAWQALHLDDALYERIFDEVREQMQAASSMDIG